MQPKDKDRAAEVLAALKRKPDSDLPAVVNFLRYKYEEAKDRMVACDASDLVKAQAEAKVYKKLIDEFTRQSLSQ